MRRMWPCTGSAAAAGVIRPRDYACDAGAEATRLMRPCRRFRPSFLWQFVRHRHSDFSACSHAGDNAAAGAAHAAVHALQPLLTCGGAAVAGCCTPALNQPPCMHAGHQKRRARSASTRCCSSPGVMTGARPVMRRFVQGQAWSGSACRAHGAVRVNGWLHKRHVA
eukprot:364137-Chlamydomonas_euryale.AAC.2